MAYTKRSGKAHYTRDDAGLAVDARIKFYVTEKLGPKQARTPEGFLICYDVPIARTGEMLYGPGEVPVEPGDDGIIHVVRDAAEVFRPEFMLSFVGKPIVDEHPDEAITPMNWGGEAVGAVLNPRRGTGDQADLLIADFIIYAAAAIDAVLAGKREVSCGYDAEYEQIKPGYGRQKDMVGNHVALVEEGRCGSRCAIGDTKKLSSSGDDMFTKDDSSRVPTIDRLFAAIREAFKTKDEAALNAALENAKGLTRDEGGEALHLHLGGQQQSNDAYDALNERMSALESGHQGIMDALEEIKGKVGTGAAAATDETEAQLAQEEEAIADEIPEELREKAKQAQDSVYMSESFQQVVAAAEILMPGIQVPAFNVRAKPKATFDSLCKMRRTALDLAFATPEGRAAVEAVNGGKRLVLDGMSCRDVRTLFNSAVAVRKVANNSTKDRGATTTVGGTVVTRPALTAAELNKRNREAYGQGA